MKNFLLIHSKNKFIVFYYTALYLLFTFCPIANAACAQDITAFETSLTKGQSLAEDGEYIHALETWDKSTSTNSSEYTDPRIGRTYIELITDLQLDSHYEQAVEMYKWGLSNPSRGCKEELENELKRLKPLVTIKEYNGWRRRLHDGQLRHVG